MNMYVDVFKGKDDKIDCMIYFDKSVYPLHGYTVEQYVDLIVNGIINKDDTISVFVDCRGLGYAMFDSLKAKYQNTFKLHKGSAGMALNGNTKHNEWIVWDNIYNEF